MATGSLLDQTPDVALADRLAALKELADLFARRLHISTADAFAVLADADARLLGRASGWARPDPVVPDLLEREEEVDRNDPVAVARWAAAQYRPVLDRLAE